MKSLALPTQARHTVPTSHRGLEDLRGGSVVKKLHVFVLLCIPVVTAALPLAAQPIHVTATIPFEFYVGDRTMPAGEYTISNGIETNVLSIRTRDSRAVVNATSMPRRTADGGTPAETLLLFRRYGNEYYLNEIWSSAAPFGRELLKYRTERELSKSAGVRPHSVFVLAQDRGVRNTVRR